MRYFRLIKGQLARYVSRLKKSFPRHRRWYQLTAPRRPRSDKATSVGDLPIELFQEVMKILHDGRDKKSVMACSLVSQRWREVALPYLFSTIAVREERDFSDFLAFIAESPHVFRCVRTLTLNGAGDLEGGPRLDCSAFSALFPDLTRLRQLFLEDLTLQVRVTGVGTCEESAAWLEALELDDVHCEDFEGSPLPVIPAILDAVPITSVNLLRLVRLGDVADETKDDFLVGVPSRAIDVRHLSVVAPDGAATAAYFACYEKLVRVGSLRCVSTFCETWGDAEQFATFLCSQNSSVTTIDLDITMLMKQDRRPGQLPPHRWQRLAMSISTCMSLASLRLHIPWNKTDPESPVQPRSFVFARLFSASIPPTLREFQVWLKLPRDWSAADAHTSSNTNELWDMSCLDRVLCDRDRFPELQRVLVIIESYPLVLPRYIYALEGRIAEEELPRLDGRGLLYFQWHTPVSYD